MAVIETWLHQDLQEPVKVNHLDGNLFSNNGNGNRIGVVLTNNGEALASISGTVSGYVVTADGSTVPCTGSKSGNRASILIPAAAYQSGSIFITVFVTDGTTVTTIGAVSTTVMRSRTNAQVDPGSTVTDWTQTINAAMQSVETAAENLGGIVAVPYASITFPVPLGKYTYYNNNLYRCISPIASSESFTAAHWTQVRLGNDVSDLKSALSADEKLFYDQYTVASNNLFDNSTVIDGKTINASGVIVDNTGTWVSRKIYVDASTIYYIWGGAEIYAEDGTALHFHSITDAGLYTMPSNASYMIATGPTSQLSQYYVNKDSNKGYDEYKKVFKNTIIPIDKTLTESGTPADAKVVGDKVSMLEDYSSEIVLSNNLLNKNALTYGKTVNASGVVTDATDSNWISEKIPVIAGYVYYIWGNAGIYQSDGTFLALHTISMAGLMEMPANSAYMMCTGNTSNLSSWYVNKFKNLGNDTYKSITLLEAKLNGITVDKNGGGDYTSLTKALWDNIGLGLTFYVKPGEYDIITEYKAYFGDDVFDASKFDANNDPIAHSAWYEGLPIRDACIFMDSNAVVKFNYTGSVQGVINWFSPFKYTAPGGELHGGQIICSNCRYAIHDDCYGSSFDRRITDGVYIYYRSARNVAIGGGVGKSSYVEFKNSYVDSGPSGYGIWYHNATLANAQNFVSIHDNYATAYIEIQTLGPSTLISKALVSNNKCRGVEKIANSDVDNFELIAWNNVT